MESVIIVAPFLYDDELRSRFERVAGVVAQTADGLVVTNGSSRVYLVRNEGVRDEYEPEELAAVTASIASPVFYSIDFSDIDLCKRVLEAIADDPMLLVDNDHGMVLPGPEFVRALRTRPGWDWREDPP